MTKRFAPLLTLVLCLALLTAGLAQASVELRFLCFQDRNECQVYADLLARFSEANPDILVAVEVADEGEIEARMAAGQAPDMARISDFQALAGHYLDLSPWLSAELSSGFPEVTLEALRGGAEASGLYGYPDALEVVAPFVNISLFERAGVELPGADADWPGWLAALSQVATAIDMDGEPLYALAVDNKDHRLAGPAMSLGAVFFDEEGALTLPAADGMREFLGLLDGLLENDLTPADTLLGTGSAEGYFTRGQAVMYICGSWKAQAVAAAVGEAFEWAIVPSPAGPEGGASLAQARALVGLAGSQHPAAVARVMAFLLEDDNLLEFAARSLSIPAREDLAAAGIAFQTDDKVAAALNDFAREVPTMADSAHLLDLHPQAAAYYAASNEHLRAYFRGELSLDAAIAGLREALALAAEPMQ